LEEGNDSLDHFTQEKGISLFLKAAKLRSPEAAGFHAHVYSGSNPGIEADHHEKRLHWLQKGAEWGGVVSSAVDLTKHYAHGDAKMARKWTKRAARFGDKQTHTMLHECSNSGCNKTMQRVLTSRHAPSVDWQSIAAKSASVIIGRMVTRKSTSRL